MKKLAFTTALLTLALGCAEVQTAIKDVEDKLAAQNGENKADATAYVGEVTVQNKSSTDVCSFEITYGKNKEKKVVRHQTKIAVGGEAKFNAESAINGIQALGCETYIGDASFSPLTQSTIVLGGDALDGVAHVKENNKTFDQVVTMVGQMNRLPKATAAIDADLAKKMMGAFNEWASLKGFEPAVMSKLAYKEWVVLRNRRTGVPVSRRHWAWIGRQEKNGECMLQVHSFVQQHNGSDFDSAVNYEGMLRNTGYDRSCEIVDWVAKQEGAVRP